MSVSRIKPVPCDLDIAQSAVIKPISEIAEKFGIDSRDLVIV